MFRRIGIVFVAMLFVAGMAHAQTIDFEDESLADWEVVDDMDLGDAGPSTWQIIDTVLGLDGKVLHQGSNIWGDATDSCLLGTIILYKGSQFTNFVLDVDVAASDNDGMGLVWAYTALDSHYRAIMINDRWPDVSVDGVEGPFMKIAKRISNENPWYELLEVVKDDYVPYEESVPIHWTLTVDSGNFEMVRSDGLSVSTTNQDYAGGYVGIQLYAQQAEFDNFTITPLDTSAVEPADKMATAWGAIKGD